MRETVRAFILIKSAGGALHLNALRASFARLDPVRNGDSEKKGAPDGQIEKAVQSSSQKYFA
jgi:hypothetical protein